ESCPGHVRRLGHNCEDFVRTYELRDVRRQQLEPVAPRVRRVEAAGAGERVVPLDRFARGLEPPRKVVELLGRKPESWMCLPRRRERLLDSDVELVAISERE